MLQSELDGKRVVVALGGNALGETPGEQLKLLENTSKNLAVQNVWPRLLQHVGRTGGRGFQNG